MYLLIFQFPFLFSCFYKLPQNYLQISEIISFGIIWVNDTHLPSCYVDWKTSSFYLFKKLEEDFLFDDFHIEFIPWMKMESIFFFPVYTN